MLRENITKQIKNIIRPNKLLGQHFLHDKNVLDKIIETAKLTKNDTILEIGPGLGVLTRELAKYAGQVIAVEKDKTLAELLTKQLANEKIDNVKIIADDILEINFSALFGGHTHPTTVIPAQAGIQDSGSRVKPGMTNGYKVVANIPYYLTSHLIRLLLESADPPQYIVLLIQKEVAQRICAKPPKMSLLAASVQFYAQPKIIASVSRKSFRPHPKVDSAIIKITPHQWCHPRESGDPCSGSRIPPSLKLWRASKYGMTEIEIKRFFILLHAGFSHPRKQLLGNLSSELVIAKEKASLALARAGIKNSQRAETLTIEDWIELSKDLNL